MDGCMLGSRVIVVRTYIHCARQPASQLSYSSMANTHSSKTTTREKTTQIAIRQKFSEDKKSIVKFSEGKPKPAKGRGHFVATGGAKIGHASERERKWTLSVVTSKDDR
jgi:hypothetical protein